MEIKSVIFYVGGLFYIQVLVLRYKFRHLFLKYNSSKFWLFHKTKLDVKTIEVLILYNCNTATDVCIRIYKQYTSIFI